LKSVLYLAKLPQNTSPKRRLVGMQPCRKPWNVCYCVCNKKTVISSHTEQFFFEMASSPGQLVG
jgi:hypothetical protein